MVFGITLSAKYWKYQFGTFLYEQKLVIHGFHIDLSPRHLYEHIMKPSKELKIGDMVTGFNGNAVATVTEKSIFGVYITKPPYWVLVEKVKNVSTRYYYEKVS